MKLQSEKDYEESNIVDSEATLLLSEPVSDQLDEVNGSKVVRCPIPTDLPVQDGERFLFLSKRQRDLTHALHKYPAKFIPDLPNWFIRRYSKVGDLVLDPFMGSGTTNLEAALLLRNSVGVDVDSFSRFIARVKTTPIKDSELLQPVLTLRDRIRSEYKSHYEYDSPNFPYRDHWFNPHVLNELAFIKSTIGSMECSPSVRDLMLLSMSSIVKEVSEANHNCLRTCIRRNNRKNVTPNTALTKFVNKLDFNYNAVKQLSSLEQLGDVVIPVNSDARVMTDVEDTSIDLAVTSPPYLNAIDYPRTHQLELYWLGFATGSLVPLKQQHIGTETIKASFYNSFVPTGCDLADEVIQKIFAVDKRRAGIASRYMIDMFKNLSEVYRVLKPHGRYVIIIGNNRVRGNQFETWRYLAWYAESLGYQLESYFLSGIINHFMKIPRAAQMQDDHILVLRRKA